MSSKAKNTKPTPNTNTPTLPIGIAFRLAVNDLLKVSGLHAFVAAVNQGFVEGKTLDDAEDAVENAGKTLAVMARNLKARIDQEALTSPEEIVAFQTILTCPNDRESVTAALRDVQALAVGTSLEPSGRMIAQYFSDKANARRQRIDGMLPAAK